ncbi:hypothetical protein [Pyrococcus abyssi]|uniref:CARD domain-containing protein n=1 Tax=Pyrococcus abyssi (strain GE5 / Orsay) TaxID=272844 RepID=Q9V032_PYRAB|nr:hypothetical protein [Pyrococcus abyssi]CAB49874.1 Hypothetical protein PAB0649 [Pyrococcus abyssi GE5]CCE70372.1 TPA: hypothetical protein PAB0649 [Pyrococcus abyssi GE5]
MKEIIIVVPRKRFKELKNVNIAELIQRNLEKAEITLEAEYINYLLEKRARLLEKLSDMEGKIEELRSYYNKVLQDNLLMKSERERLNKENSTLRRELKSKVNS